MTIRNLPTIVFTAALFAFGLPVFGQAVFPGSGLGAIPDTQNTSGCQQPGTPKDVTFDVTGMSGSPRSVSVEMAFAPAHGWGGDVVATLISPDGTEFVVFGYTGISSAQGTFDGGDGSDLVGPYVFSDAANGNWWAAADSADDEAPIPAGSYRSSQIGGAGASGAQTSMNAAFASIPTANGTWKLRFTDGCNTDSGSVSAAALTLSSSPSGTPQKPNVDMNGLGRSDFVVIRLVNPSLSAFEGIVPMIRSKRERLQYKQKQKEAGITNPAVDPSFQWWTQFTDAPGYSASTFGNAIEDTETPADFDGDGKADIAVWKSPSQGSPGFFWVSSIDSTIGSSVLGQTGDDPSVAGDYDGDGKADPAVFRCPDISDPDGQCYFYYKGTSNNPNGEVTTWPLGFGNAFSVLPMPGDFDGDQKFDFCVYRSNPESGAQGQFVLQTSSNLGTAEYINYGLYGIDYLIPASDFDGDGKTDFAVARMEGGNWNFYVMERDGGGSPGSPIRFGLQTDFITPGDYDGDNKTDIAVYRWGQGGQNSNFWVLGSQSGQVFVVPFGLEGDVPAARWRIQ